MARHEEPMDIVDSDFDNKENSLHHNNVLPFTEKGYEELDVSELNMKLRYSITPASSPMSKSFTANCIESRSLVSEDDSLNVTVTENSKLTRSLNSTITKNDNRVSFLKTLPLQALPKEQFSDKNRSISGLRSLDSTVTQDNKNVTVSGPIDIDENLSLPSSSSSAVQTPEATTPTKDIPKIDGGSPIMRGIKTVLNMFRSSQSPIPPVDSEDIVKPDICSPAKLPVTLDEPKLQAILASTPISAHWKKDTSPTKRSSPYKDSVVFNDDLEKELQWKDETTIIFSQERIPIHKLFFQQSQVENKMTNKEVELPKQDIQDDLNSTVEYMDVSYNDSIKDRTVTDIQILKNKTDCTIAGESDGEFVDCETTFAKNESVLVDDLDKTPVIYQTLDLDFTKDVENTNENTSGSRLKQIILNTTQDILDATLSIKPEDLISEALENTKDVPSSALLLHDTEVNIISNIEFEKCNENIDIEKSLTSQENLPVLNKTENVTCALAKIKPEGEDFNNTRTTANFILNQPLLDHTVESPLTNLKHEVDHNVDNKMENISADGIVAVNKSIVLPHNLNSTITNKATVWDSKIIEDKILSDNNSSNFIPEIAHDYEIDRTSLNNTEIIDHNSSSTNKSSVTQIFSSVLSEETINESLPNSDDKVEDPIKDVTMLELPVNIPLPDEDDLDKELDKLIETTTEAFTAPSSLPFDLVDDIKAISETSEEIHNVPLEGAVVNLTENLSDDDKVILPEVLLPHNTVNFEAGDGKGNELVVFDSKVINAIQEGIDQVDFKNQKPSLFENPNQIVSIEVLTENSLSLNILGNGNDNEIHQVPDDVEEMNRTDNVIGSLHTIINSSNIEQNILQTQDALPKDIHVSDIELKPLPDILNQTITMPNVENLKPNINIPESVTLEQQAHVVNNFDNVANELDYPEVMPQAINKVVLQMLSDANGSPMVEPENELTNVTKDILHIAQPIKGIINDPIPNVTEIGTTDMPVTENTTDVQPNSLNVVPTEGIYTGYVNQPLDTDNDPFSECSVDVKTVDEEIILSKNSGPFVSVIAEDISKMQPKETFDSQNVNNQPAPIGKVVYTPPASPPISSKGYNFDFDETDDPFAMKSKIRLSPSLDTPTESIEARSSSKSVEKCIPEIKPEINNRRNSQSERKRPVAPKRKFNATFCGGVIDNTTEKPLEKFAAGEIKLESPANVALDPSSVTIEEDAIIQEARIVHEKTLNVTKGVLKTEIEEKPIETPSIKIIEADERETVLSKEIQIPSSSEHSTYFSASTSSSESIHTKNVFNLPEIDDINFNPFATKSKMRQSPPLTPEIENLCDTKSKINSSPESSITHLITVSSDDKIETELMEKDASSNLSNTSTSSKATDDRNGTIRELNTEDEDTIEGPFLEADDGENINMIQFNDIPAQGNDNNLDNGELFIDAEAFEFLLNQNKSNTVVDSGKESLFLKFDPLFAKRMSSITSDSVVASLNKIQKRQSTPTKATNSPCKDVVSPIAGPSNLNVTQDLDRNVIKELDEDLNITVSKPTMVVPPAVNPVTPRNKSLTPNRSNRRSITFTSPAMAVIDRLLSLSGNSSLVHDTNVSKVSREQNEADLALIQLRELLAEKEMHVYSLRSESKELKDRLTNLESHLRSLETESHDRLKKINDLNNQLAEKTKINKSMAGVVEEYERTIASLISEIAQDKKMHAEERIKLINERDEQTAHLASMEVSFSDLHSKYEKTKQIILSCKANEDAYKKSIKQFEESLSKMQTNYEFLKQHATSKLNHANQELEKMNRTHEAEVLKLNAMIKRKELHVTSLEESLAQKTKANEELTAICDELINKVG